MDLTGFGQARSQVARFIDFMIEQHSGTFDAWKQRKFSSVNTSGCLHSSGDGNDDSNRDGIESNNIQSAFDMVVFDLDDTLVPVMGPIRAANQEVKQYIDTYMTKSASTIHEHFASTIKTVSQENPLIAHDYTEMRSMALTELCTQHDESHLVTAAMEVCTACMFCSTTMCVL